MIFFDAGHSSWSIISFSDFDSDAIEPTGSDWLTANIHVIAEYIYWETIRELDKEVYFPEGRQPIFLDQLHRYLTLQPSAEGSLKAYYLFIMCPLAPMGTLKFIQLIGKKLKKVEMPPRWKVFVSSLEQKPSAALPPVMIAPPFTYRAIVMIASAAVFQGQ